MFESLTEKLEQVFKRLKGQGRLTEDNIQSALREVRISLLEADVNFKVVKEFIEAVKTKALGQEVLRSLTPANQLIKVVNEELVSLMGGQGGQQLKLSGKQPVSIMLVGLQGSGKTTTAGKLARYLKEEKKRRPYLVPADIYRPAAIEQLQTLAQDLNADYYPTQPGEDPVSICLQALKNAAMQGLDTLIIDTAGRWHVDDELMLELKRIKEKLLPEEILLVADAMTGQEAVNVATRFNEVLDLSGVILTKMDGDARGGAALSIKSVTQKPIKFIGVGEKLDALEVFYPERMASRILGMGDVLSLIEKAQASIDLKKAEEFEKKLRKESFTLEDFRDQIQQIKKMGSLENILEMLPGVNLKNLKAMNPGDKELIKMEAILNSMTKKERLNPAVFNGSRRMRVAKGSGTTVQDVNRLLKNYLQAKKMLKSFNKGALKGVLGRGMPFNLGK
jgi:signal recognition particle subunit SRP54